MNKYNLILLTFGTFLSTGCTFGYEPGSQVSQSGDGYYQGTDSGLDLKDKLIHICHARNCSRFEARGITTNTNVDLDMHITTNDFINIQKLSTNRALVYFSQKEMTKPSIKTILVLRDLKELGFDLKYIGGEKWHCGDKPLKRRYCRQETIQGQGQDFLDYIVADNQMEFSYKDGARVIPL